MASSSNAQINRIFISPLRMCRVCLSEKRQVFIDVFGPNEPFLAQFVREYYKVEVKRDDIHRGKSTKLCQRCMENIDVWRGHVDQANACQTKYEYMSSVSSSQVVNKKRCLFISKKKQKASKSKKRKRSMHVREIQSTSTSNNMIQSFDESNQQSTSASIIQIPSRGIESVQCPSDFPSKSNSTEIIPFVPSSNKIIPFTSTSTEMIPLTSTEIIPFASTEIIPSTSTEIIPFTSTTEIIPFTSTSTEIIPFTSTPTEIIQPTPSSTGIEPIWYTRVNAITSSSFPPERFVRPISFKVECVCIFCTYQYTDVSRNMYSNIMFCSKHSKPFACLIDDCNTVFPNKDVFLAHYRTHLNLNSTSYFCRKCMAILDCPRRSITKNHVHQNLADLLKCCSLNFATMNKFVLHKIINHNIILVTGKDRSHILNKSDPIVMFPNKCKIEPIDVKDDVILTSKVEKTEVNEEDAGNYKCTHYNCFQYFTSVKEYVEHSSKKHNNIISLKDPGIKLCPLCNNNYLFNKFVEHIENCTNTMKIGDKKLNYFACVHCKCIFTKLSASNFRNHFMFCKSFNVITIDDKAYKKCNYCTYQTCDDNLAVIHATSNCIFFQLKMRYAMGPDEKMKVLQRMEFDEESAKEQQAIKNCTDNEALPGTSKIMCNTSKQCMLNTYNFFCNNCHKFFFDKYTFLHHMTILGFTCRDESLIYCPRCLTDFNSEIEYNEHLPKMPKASPLYSVKTEVVDPNYNSENIIIENVAEEHTNQNDNYEESSSSSDDDNDVKVFEMNHNRYFQVPGVLGVDIRSSAQCPEQEVSNYDFSEQEIEYTNDDYMQCVVEEKPDLNQMMIDNNIQ
ncbi:uncharacterized protein LOC132917054 isoform X2 [Rhopalosiphum padi]|uniref:uncharacterized protein LOC132917054 isoform X2 n=1 Tax=Rhopalosiphum padi TaxID=40932 RepID=UPI00298EA31C|nr:uncharacterized protein LOC132917054 isoform X2 [Rhopalosiphum padi]